MRFTTISFLIICLAVHSSTSAGKQSGGDSTCAAWVIFSDKSGTAKRVAITPRALNRRARAGFAGSEADWPVRSDYLRAIEKTGARQRHIFSWSNAVSYDIPRSQFSRISEMSFVKKILPVSIYRRQVSTAVQRSPAKGLATAPKWYGSSFEQLSMLSVPLAQELVVRKRGAEPGTGVLIAFFDSGFWLKHRCFSRVEAEHRVVSTRDFIDNDLSVADPDSVRGNSDEPYYGNDEHGTRTLSLVSGYDPGEFIGAAWGASFALARTENTYYDPENGEREVHTEEDDWAAAVMWAESLGVDIISSSLGYRDGFHDTIIIMRNGIPDTITDYSYSDLDGKTTIVSRAASYAVERGMIVVNAMGNEGAHQEKTLAAPADVDGVVSVGAIDSDSIIAYFSSTGPTADGRTKPDLVAQGISVVVPDLRGSNPTTYSASGMGTSFSTPLISGVIALIRQSHPDLTSAQIRDRLYRSCSLLPEQDSVDNIYGRGMPDALLACLDSNELFLAVRDSVGNSLSGVKVFSEEGDSIGISDSLGIVLLHLATLPAIVTVKHPGGSQELLTITQTPDRRNVVFNFENTLVVRLLDRRDTAVTSGTVFFRAPDASADTRKVTDDKGETKFVYYTAGSAQAYAAAPGYRASNRLSVNLRGGVCTLSVVLEERPVSRIIVYPTVIKSKRHKQKLKAEFVASPDNPRNYDQFASASVRSVDGLLVWSVRKLAEEYEPVLFEWDCRSKNGKLAVPGIYFFILEYGGKIYRRKFLIAG